MSTLGKTTIFVLLAALLAAGGLAFFVVDAAVAADRGPIEICNNKIDDDGDREVDEAACLVSASSRPISANGIVPETWGDNPSCSEMGYGFGFKLDGAPNGTFTLTAANGELTGGAPSDSVNTVTVSSDGTFATWSSTLSMDAVFIKGGSEGGNLYVYDPESTGPDSGLATPSEQGISHIEFCYDYELSASKTANAEYTRTYTWEIFKSVDPDAHTGFFGDEFSSDYEVEVDQTVVDSDYKVTGEITIDNPTPFAVSFRVIDAVGGAPATVNCPSTDLAPGGQVVCNYSADLGGPVDGMNVATIFSGSPSVDGATAQAPYAFGDPTTVNGFETINVTDYFDGDLVGDDLGSASGDYTFTYSRDFECPVDEAEYTDGVFTDAFPNEAEIDETGQSDDANVDLTCYKPVVSKDAETEWYREYTWEISKSVDPDAHTGFAGDIFGSDYEVFVDQTVADYGYRAFGSIEVTNPAGVEIDVNVADAVDGVDASVDCGDGTGSLTVAAGATASCDYTVGLSDNTDRTNTATVSFNGYDFEATADVDFGAPIIVGFPEINVTDYFDGDLAGDDLGSADGDFTFEYSRDFECPIDEAEYTDGVFTDAFPNEAEIDETGQSDDANVDLTCYIPASARVVKTTTEGGEDIGQFPFTFELYDPGDVLVESKGLNGAGEVVFDAELEDEGTWTVVEVLPDGWVSTTATECTFDVAFPGSADETYSCSFDNVEMSRLDLVKLTNGQPTTVQTWTFDLYEGPDGFGGTLVASDATPPALLDFGDSDLDPFATYTLCEREVPAGYSTFWQIDTDGDSIGDVTVLPYNPNADDDPPEDLGNRCVDVGAGTGIDLVPGTTLHFIVDNQQPGGAPRTPGYWKNWNMCTGGNQQFTAASNGGWEEGFWLLEDVLDPSIGGGIVWDDIQADTFEFPIEACEVAVDILDKREVGDPAIVGDGKKAANDPLHNLATHLLAAQLNFGAGACTTQEALDAALAAETLLDQYNFDGDGHDPLPKKSDDAALANELAGILDAYNNGEFCGDGVD